VHRTSPQLYLATTVPRTRAWGRDGLVLLPVGLVLLMLAACLVRTSGMPAIQGTMQRDESRLLLASQGILAHGLPVLPDGFLYTRGLLPAYINAAIYSIFGVSDHTSRLASIVASTLLVLAVYRLGFLAGGQRPAIVAAIIVAFSPPLVLQSREGWLYSLFLLWMALALGWLVRDQPGDRLRAGLATVAALLTHELAVLLIPVALLLDVGRAWDVRRSRARSAAVARCWPSSWRSVVLFWTIVLAGVAALAALALSLRAPTLGGSTVEIREFLRPGLDPRGLQSSLRILTDWHPWLLPIAVLGLPLTRAGWRSSLAGRGMMPCLLMALVVLGFTSFGLVRRGEPRYMLAVVPFLAVVAAVSLDRVGPRIVGACLGLSRPRASRHVIRLTLLVLLVAVNLDPLRLRAEAEAHAPLNTWLQAMDDRAPTDLFATFAPTITSRYLGRTDFWLRPEGYSKYVWADQSPRRDIHTGAIVIRSTAELRRLVLLPYRGRTLWVLLTGETAEESSKEMRGISRYLLSLASETRRPADGRLVLKLQL
jgi:4-amino-4-deoxy-L-arabinose transferase-like glycosyltransferase